MKERSVQRAPFRLRTDAFRTCPRGTTKGIYTCYLGTPSDPRLDVNDIDRLHGATGRFGVAVHYVIQIDGTIQIARHPMTISAFGPHRLRHSHIAVGLVGGRDQDTGKQETSMTPEQREALEWLYQSLADALQVPLDVTEWLGEKQDPEVELEVRLAAEADAFMAQQTELGNQKQSIKG